MPLSPWMSTDACDSATSDANLRSASIRGCPVTRLPVSTVSYPIKGTPYYQQVQSKLVQLQPWAQTSDREIRIAGRHSRAYYAHADKLLRDEVQFARLSEDPVANSALLEDLRMNIRASRNGLLATQSEVEA